MSPVLRILINAQIRQWLLVFLGGALVHRFGFAEEVLRYLRETNLDYVTIVMGIGAAIVGVYTRWRSKAKLKVALSQPSGTSEERVEAIVKDTGVISTLKAPVLAALLLPAALLMGGCEFAGSYTDRQGNTYRAGYHQGNGFAK